MTSLQVKQKMVFNPDVVLCSNFRMFQEHSEVIFKTYQYDCFSKPKCFDFFLSSPPPPPPPASMLLNRSNLLESVYIRPTYHYLFCFPSAEGFCPVSISKPLPPAAAETLTVVG